MKIKPHHIGSFFDAITSTYVMFSFSREHYLLAYILISQVKMVTSYGFQNYVASLHLQIFATLGST